MDELKELGQRMDEFIRKIEEIDAEYASGLLTPEAYNEKLKEIKVKYEIRPNN